MTESEFNFRRQEKIANVVFGLSFFSWAFLGLTVPDDAGSIVRWCIAALHVTAGTLILFRAPVRVSGRNTDMALCVPAVISSGFVFHFAGPTDSWNVGPSTLFLVGTAWTIFSLGYLGRNFAVFPAVRAVVQVGPYVVVRHPAYLGELGLVVACVWASPWTESGPYILAAFLFAVTTIVVRIFVEEQLLKSHHAYRDYCVKVKWRLIPKLW